MHTIDHTQDGRERVIHNSLIRNQRSVENNMNLVINGELFIDKM